MIRRRPSAAEGTATIAARAAADKFIRERRLHPQRLKPNSKQCNYRSAKALRHPKADATPSFSATWKAAALLCAVAVALLARPATAAELAILRNGFSIRHEHRLAMGTTTRLFFSADDSSFTDVPTADITGYEKDLSLPAPAESQAFISSPMQPAKSAPALNQVVDTASATFHLDPDLVNSVIHAESGFNSRAVSPKGARGLMQLMPSTASQLGVNDAFDPEANVAGGSRYLRELLERYNFDLVKALAAYNAGPLRVEQYQGVPPFRETRAYVARIVHEYNTKKIAQEKLVREKEAKEKQVSSKAPSHAHRTSKPAAVAAAGSPR